MTGQTPGPRRPRACATALTGASLPARLERVASQFLARPHESVTIIALECGFGGSAAFARAFKAAFGLSASRWRTENRKIHQGLRKHGEARESHGVHDGPHRSPSEPPAPSPFWRSYMEKMRQTHALEPKPARAVRIETVAPATVAYVRHVGPYAGDTALFQRLFGRLFQWLGPRGLVGPSTRCLTIYHEDPAITDDDKLRMSCCATVPEGTRGEGDIGVMPLDGGTFAVASFELDASEYAAAWQWLLGTWLPDSGYQPDDRHCFELYLNDPNSHPEKKHVVEIWEPVRPL